MKNSSPEISVIIPNFNGRDLLEKNLPQVIKAYQNKLNGIKEIIIVDDASTDSSVNFLRKNFRQVKIICHKINRGFPASVNTGARSARGKLLALLNSDCVPEEDFLVEILPHFKSKVVFAVSLHEKGYGWAKGKFENGFIVHEPGPEDKMSHETFWVNGGSGIFRRSYWMKLNGMDEKLLSPFYWEDTDLSFPAAKPRFFIFFWADGGI